MTLELAVDGGPLADPAVRQAILVALNRLHLSDHFDGARVKSPFFPGQGDRCLLGTMGSKPGTPGTDEGGASKSGSPARVP
jgi:hypothetical protein